MLLFGFVFFTGKILAQEQERVIDNIEVQSLLALSESIQSGEIGLLINYHRKGKPAIETKEYNVFFSKTGKFNKLYQVEFNYNILDIKDSMQYVFNGQTWYIINHKKRTCLIDTATSKEDGILPPYVYFKPLTVLFNGMFSFYAKDFLGNGFYNAVAITDIQKIENLRLLKIEVNSIAPGSSKINEKVLWIKEFEWDINKSLLFRYCKAVKDDSGYSKKTVVKTETLLTNASLNDEKFTDSSLYNGLNFATSYKIKYIDYKNKRK